MKKFKRLITVLLSIIMLFSLGACGDDTSPDLTLLAITEEEDPYPLFTQVGFIYDTSVATGTITAIFENGRFELERTLGVETRYIENVLLQQFDDAVDTLIAGGCTVIVAASNRYNSAVVLAARRHLNVHFLSFGSADMAFNLSSLQPYLFHAAYLQGYAAAFNTASNRIGLVVDPNMYHSFGIASAFALGVRELNHAQVSLSLNWALSTRMSDTERAIADLREQGCDIIFIYQAEDYGIRRCEQLGIRVISFGFDVHELAENNYLSAAHINVKPFLIDQVRTVMWGNFSRSLVRGGIDEGAVRLRFNEDLLTPGTTDLTNALHTFISDGSAPVFKGEVKDRDNIVRIEKGVVFPINAIFAIEWLPENIDVVKDMSEPLTNAELTFSTLEIKR
jgi:basic membrane lipoprotein Med (substrate-binding protein (PBP1-ABC) superfamily)